MKKQWYHFKKEVNGLSAETYVELEASLTDEDVEPICLIWAEDVNKDGMSRGFTYSWDEVELPDNVWLEKEKKNIEYKIKQLKEKLDYLNLVVSN